MGVPCLVDPDGTLLKQIGIARSNFPIATIWDTTGTLWWWSYVDVVPTGQDLKKFLAELTASTQPFEEVKKFHSHFTREACVAESVGVGELGVSAAGIGRVVSLEDDSLHRVGPLTGCVISGNGRWLAAMDMYLQCIRVYELEKGGLWQRCVAIPMLFVHVHGMCLIPSISRPENFFGLTLYPPALLIQLSGPFS